MSNSPWKCIRARFPSKCKACGAPIRAGNSVYWQGKGSKGVRCGASGIPSTTPAPEASIYSPLPSPAINASKEFRHEFNSVGEAIEFAISDIAPINSSNQSVIARMKEYSGKSFWNRRTLDDIRAMVNSPDVDLMGKVETMREKLGVEFPLPSTVKRQRRRGLCEGDEIDADRYARRVPEIWEKVVRVSADKRIVRIGVNICVNASERAENMLWRGAAAIALSDYLQASGASVEIVAFDASSSACNQTTYSLFSIICKRADMPADQGAIVTALCELGFFRAVLFLCEAKMLPGYVDYGTSSLLRPEDAKTVDFLLDTNVKGESAAIAWIESAINKQAIAA